MEVDSGGGGGVTSTAPSVNEYVNFTPLGGGCEVGRSCHLLQFSGKTIMLDCGLHPAFTGIDSLPYFDQVNPADVDMILITHFHLDHAAALPYFLSKTNFSGQVVMTHPTKSIYQLILQDYVKVSTMSVDETLYSESDLLASMERISTINYHQTLSLRGINVTAYNAGHVLGAAMFTIDIAGVRILYTGDYSRSEDRHLMAAEIPKHTPDILIIEATYGIQTLPPIHDRERRFTQFVSAVVTRGGKCLIPVFALGRAQELLLILDEYWAAHPALHSIPIYYASALAKRCLKVYKTYVNMMNARIQQISQVSNPFEFKFIRNLKDASLFDDSLPCVVMASPGMLQNGLSRDLLEQWATDEANGCIVPGYSVEGTMAKHILTQPQHITTLSGQRIPLRMSVDYISFSAHADFTETSAFIQTLLPAHIILVHGDATEGCGRLKHALNDKYNKHNRTVMNITSPKNCQCVSIEFEQSVQLKVVGALAATEMSDHKRLRGVVVRKDFVYQLISVDELSQQTPVQTAVIRQSLQITWPMTFQAMTHVIGLLFHIETADDVDAEIRARASATESAETMSGLVKSEVVKDDDANGHLLVASTLEATEAKMDQSDDTAPPPPSSSSAPVAPAIYRPNVPFIRLCGSVYIQFHQQQDSGDDSAAQTAFLLIEWESNPLDDMIVDSAIALLMNVQANVGGAKLIGQSKDEHSHNHAPPLPAAAAPSPLSSLVDYLVGLFGSASLDANGDAISVRRRHISATVNTSTFAVDCVDVEFAARLHSAVVRWRSVHLPVTEEVMADDSAGVQSLDAITVYDEKKQATNLINASK